MAKIVNMRRSTLLCLLLVAGILICLGFYYHYAVYSIVALLVIVTIMALYAILYRRFIRSAIALTFFIIGMVSVLLYIYCGATVLCEQNAELSGRVCSMYQYDMYVQLVLGDVSCERLDEYGNYISPSESLDGYTMVYVSYADPQLDNISEGCTVQLRGIVDKLYVLKDEINTYYYKYNYNYTVAEANIYNVEAGDTSLSQKVDKYVADTLSANMPNNYGTAYAMLLGDKAYMPTWQYQAYQDIGIAHLFAISGMHIGIVVAFIVFLLSIMRIDKKYHIYIVMPPLILYGYLCGFSPSVTRAIIMSLIVLLSRVMHSGTDLLSSISIAMIVILVFRPLYIFDVSFLLSFGSVYGIATVGYAIIRALNSRTSNKTILSICNVVILSFSVSFSTLFLVAQFFGKVSTVGVIVNMFIVPILPVVFVACLLGLIPHLNILLVLVDALLAVLARLATHLSSMSWSTAVVPSIGIAILVWIVLLFVLGGYVNVRRVARCIVVAVLCVAIIALSLINILPHGTTDSIVVLDTSNATVVVTERNSDTVHVVCNLHSDYDTQALASHLSHIRYSKLYVYCTDVQSVKLSNMMLLYNNYHLTKLYYFDAYSSQNIEGYGVQILHIDKGGYTNNSVVIGSIYSGGIVGVDIVTRYLRMAVLDSRYYYALYGIDDISGYDCIYCTSNSTMLQKSLTHTALLVPKQLYGGNIYGQNMYGNFTIEAKGGKITVNRGAVK